MLQTIYIHRKYFAITYFKEGIRLKIYSQLSANTALSPREFHHRTPLMHHFGVRLFNINHK